MGNIRGTADNLTIEFLCGGSISIQTDNAELHLIMNQGTIAIEEAHRSNDRTHISWHYTESPISHSATLHRLSSYKQ